MSYYNLLIIFLSFLAIINDVTSLDLNNSVESNLAVPMLTNYSTVNKLALRKCNCEANNVWHEGKCFPQNTSVDVILSFDPLLFHDVPTEDFDTINVTPLQCNSSTVSLTLNNVAFANNSLFHFESGENFTDSYCVEHILDGEGAVITETYVCVPNFEVPSCCPEAHYFDPVTLKCVGNENAKFNPPVWMGSSPINTTDFILYVQNFPICDINHLKRRMLESGNFTLQVQQSKILFFEWEGTPSNSFPQMTLLPTEYCIAVEQVQNYSSTYSVIFWDEFLPELCNNTSSTDKCEDVMYWLLLPLLILSSAFLIVILGLHAFMPELQKSIGSKITRCHVSALLAGFCVLIFLHIPHNANCKLFGPLVQVCFLATFFWLNVMCFDIWWKLRCHSPAGETIQSSHTRFVHYSIYAWGTPLLIGIITVIMDNSPSLEGMPGIIVPGFGKKNCWFEDRSATLIYYFGIIALLMALNLFFFVWVFIILLKANCTYKKVLKTNSKSHARMLIYLKIFGVMGVTWIFEFLSWQQGSCKYWIITDIINSLRGFILFVIFFGNRKSIKKIGERFGSINQSIHVQYNRSMNSLRKLSRKTSTTIISDAGSRRTSETMSELSQRQNNQENENGGQS